jgi:two-component system response regulator HydG
MRLKSLKSKLLLAASALVVGSSLLISLLVTQRYSRSLLTTTAAQAENLAHAIALEAADKILTHDLVALQKLLDHHVRTDPGVAYLFISRNAQPLSHTFAKEVPSDLIEANEITLGNQPSFQKIASVTGENYLDIAWPIFEGKAGVLRLGFSEEPFRRQVTKLWLQMSALTLGILVLALSGSFLFVRRISRPLAALAQATQRIDKGEVGVRVQAKGADEIATLSASFNHMVARMEGYTRRLEEQTMELERAHRQTQTVASYKRLARWVG